MSGMPGFCTFREAGYLAGDCFWGGCPEGDDCIGGAPWMGPVVPPGIVVLCCCVAAGTLLSTDVSRLVTMASRKEDIMNTTAATVVSLLKKVAAPRAPKRVWLDPPKAAPISAPFPPWMSTITIRNKQTIK